VKVFLSSTLRDLVPEREAVLKALQKKASVCYRNGVLRRRVVDNARYRSARASQSDVVLLVIGFKAGSLFQAIRHHLHASRILRGGLPSASQFCLSEIR